MGIAMGSLKGLQRGLRILKAKWKAKDFLIEMVTD